MTEHRHEIAMRWADLDSLNHVNNVVYLAYAANAREVMDALPPGSIGTVNVQFKRPILLSRSPVIVTSAVEDERVLQSITVDGAPHEFATVESHFGGHSAPVDLRQDVRRSTVAVRHTDLDAAGQVSDVHMFELFQESRIPFIDSLLPRLTPGNFVVANVTVHYHRPITWRPEPLETRTWVSRVGNSSFTIEAQLSDGEAVLASSTAILVGFDAATQSSRRFGDAERETLEARLSPAS